MKVIKGCFYFVLVAVIAVGISLRMCSDAEKKYYADAVNAFADTGVSVNGILFGYDSMTVTISSENEEVMPEDIMNIRKTINAIRTVKFDKRKYTVRIAAPSGKLIYSEDFYNVYNRSDLVYNDSADEPFDPVMLKYNFKYAIKKSSFLCKYIGFYESAGMQEKALYSEIIAEKETRPSAIQVFISEMNDLNAQGCRILRYSAVFFDGDGNALCVVSRDILYGDVIFWKSRECENVTTVFG